MPNTSRSDYVAPHRHSADDIDGLGVVLFPPTTINVGVTSGPTRTATTYALLSEMRIQTPPPDNFPMWEATIEFTGTFSHSGADNQIGIQIDVDGVTVPGTNMVSSVANDGGFVTMTTRATVYVRGGVTPVITLMWANPLGLGTATAVGTARRLEVTYRPYQPAAT